MAKNHLPYFHIILFAAASIVLLAIIFLPAAQNSIDAETTTVDALHKCYDAENPGECLRNSAQQLLAQFTIEDIISAFKKHEASDKIFLDKCHLLAHYLGQELYKESKNIAEVFSRVTPDCLAGLFHGAVEGYFIENKIAFFSNPDTIKKEVFKICSNEKSFNSAWDLENCYHGLGHALMFLTENNLPYALELCGATPNSKLKKTCYDGVFMENADSLNGVHLSKYIRPDDDYFPCTIVSGPYREECYSYALAHRFQGDTNKSVTICNGTPIEYRKACFNRIGIHLAMQHIRADEIFKKCGGIMISDFRTECISGAASALASRFGARSPIPFSLCAESSQKTEKKNCYKTVIQGVMNRDDLDVDANNICSAIPEEKYRDDCYQSLM